jgi:Zn-finger nucleic acid-binding protein
MLIPPDAWTLLFDRVSAGEPVDIGRFVPLKPGARAPVLLALLVCPACGVEMDRGVFGARSAVSIDVCGNHGVWLDAAELAPIVAQFRRLESGEGSDPDDPDAPIDAEEMALLVQIRNAESKIAGAARDDLDTEAAWTALRREVSSARAALSVPALRARLDELRMQKRLKVRKPKS